MGLCFLAAFLHGKADHTAQVLPLGRRKQNPQKCRVYKDAPYHLPEHPKPCRRGREAMALSVTAPNGSDLTNAAEPRLTGWRSKREICHGGYGAQDIR